MIDDDHLVLKDKGRQAIDYLLRNINEDGSFVYEVNAVTGEFYKGHNILRHAGTLYELCLWLKSFPDPDTLRLLYKPMRFILTYLKPWDDNLCIVENHEAKLGGAALALLALATYYQLIDDDELIPVMKGLAGFIIQCQKPNGDFSSRFLYFDRQESKHRSDYYPGQAILALTCFHNIQPDQRWLEAARSGADYLLDKSIIVSDNSNAIETWYAKALYQLVIVQPHKPYINKLRAITSANLLSFYNSKGRDATNEKRQFTSASMASLGEALVAGRRLAMMMNDDKEATKINDTIKQVLTFCLNLQIGRQKNDLDKRFYGGITKTRSCPEIRIDYVQHVLSVITSALTGR